MPNVQTGVLPREEKTTKVITVKEFVVMTGFNVIDNFGDVTINAAFQLHQVDENGDVIRVAQLPNVTRKFNSFKTPDLEAAVATISALLVSAKSEDVAKEVATVATADAAAIPSP